MSLRFSNNCDLRCCFHNDVKPHSHGVSKEGGLGGEFGLAESSESKDKSGEICLRCTEGPGYRNNHFPQRTWISIIHVGRLRE